MSVNVAGMIDQVTFELTKSVGTVTNETVGRVT
jgi:hypothetical protein